MKPLEKENKKDLKGYWICDVCVVKNGLTTKYPKGGNTCCQMPCDWCGVNDQFCTPIVDFKESKDKSWD